MTGIGIIANPKSKLNRRNPEHQEILGYIAGEAGIFKATESIEELAQVALEFKQRGIEVLAINGGDGTISHTLTAFIKAYGQDPLPAIAVLGGGTINLIKQNLALKGSPAELLFRLIQTHSQGKGFTYKELRCLRINDFYGFFCGTGLCANFLTEYYKTRTGLLGAFCLVLRLFFSYLSKSPFASELILAQNYRLALSDGEIKDIDSLSVIFSTLEKMPFNLRFFPKSRDRFQGLSISYKLENFVPRFFYDFMLRPLARHPNKWRFSDEHCFLDSKPLSYTIDGEIFQPASARLDIELGPSLRFIII